MIKNLLLVIFAVTCVTPAAWAEVTIHNDQQYIGNDGTMHIVGEIHNGFKAPLNQVNVLASLFSSDNSQIDFVKSRSLVNTIMPGMKVPFDVVISGATAKQVSSYSLDLDYKITEPKNQVIGITDSEILRDDLENIIISGTVINNGEITANTISVIATLYDREGNVAAVSKIHPEPDFLRSEDKAYFFVPVTDKTQTGKVVSYSLVAESEEYAAVPEFPFSSMILLGVSVSAYIGVTKFSNRFITNLVAASNLR